MGRKYAIHNQDKFYFVTFTVIHWIDVFIRDKYRRIFIESVRYCIEEKGLLVGAWCIMTNHVHMIIGTTGLMKLEDIIRDLKSFTSRQIRKEIESSNKESRREWMLQMMIKSGTAKSNNRDFQFWMQHNHPIEMYANYMIDTRLNYIHNNPVVAGFVDEARDWRYSSARDYEGEKGMISLYFLD